MWQMCCITCRQSFRHRRVQDVQMGLFIVQFCSHCSRSRWFKSWRCVGRIAYYSRPKMCQDVLSETVGWACWPWQKRNLVLLKGLIAKQAMLDEGEHCRAEESVLLNSGDCMRNYDFMNKSFPSSLQRAPEEIFHNTIKIIGNNWKLSNRFLLHDTSMVCLPLGWS